MYVVKGIIVILVIFAASLLVGKLWFRKGTWLESVLLGFATMLAVFNLLCIPMHINEVPFTVLFISFSVILAVAAAFSVFLSIRQKKQFTFSLYRLKPNLFFFLAVAVIVVQAVRLVVMQPMIYGDDTTYIAMINNIWHSDHIQGYMYLEGWETPPYSPKYIYTSWYPFLAYWCKLFRFHPLLLCKTFLPILTTFFTYAVFWLLGEFFFKEDMRKKSIYFLLVALLVEFENITYHFFSRKILEWPWQSKSVLYTILMPLLLYFVIKYMVHSDLKLKETMILAVVLFANGAASQMGVGFSTIMLMIFGGVMTIQNRKLSILWKTVLVCIPTGILLVASVIANPLR